MKTAYLGPEASFSHQTALEALPSTEAVPLPSFAAIFSALQSKPDKYDYAVLPVENSTNGAVFRALDLLAQCGLDPSSSLYDDVEVIAEHYLSVHHCIFVTEDSARSLPQTQRDICLNSRETGITNESTLKDVLEHLGITTLYTHPQVWGQCGNFLSKFMPPTRVERVDVSSTSAAAAFIKKHQPPKTGDNQQDSCMAAISPELAGQKNGLICLAKNIEDHPGENTTRFLILRNRRKQPPAPVPGLGPNGLSPSSIYFKSLLTFTIPHSVPGSLASALNVFSSHGFNLTAIQSRPSHLRNWHYVFFVECQHRSTGSKVSDNSRNSVQKTVTGEEGLPEMLEALKGHTEQVRWLGSWQDQLKK